MDTMTYLDALAERARLDESATGPLDRFAARVWWKIARAQYRALHAPNPTPLWYVTGGAAAAAALMVAVSYGVWSAALYDMPAPSVVDDLFAWMP